LYALFIISIWICTRKSFDVGGKRHFLSDLSAVLVFSFQLSSKKNVNTNGDRLLYMSCSWFLFVFFRFMRRLTRTSLLSIYCFNWTWIFLCALRFGVLLSMNFTWFIEKINLIIFCCSMLSLLVCELWCIYAFRAVINQGINAGDVKKLQDAGIYTCNGLMMFTKKVYNFQHWSFKCKCFSSIWLPLPSFYAALDWNQRIVRG
jgi:hypothetical protein